MTPGAILLYLHSAFSLIPLGPSSKHLCCLFLSNTIILEFILFRITSSFFFLVSKKEGQEGGTYT